MVSKKGVANSKAPALYLLSGLCLVGVYGYDCVRSFLDSDVAIKDVFTPSIAGDNFLLSFMVLLFGVISWLLCALVIHKARKNPMCTGTTQVFDDVSGMNVVELLEYCGCVAVRTNDSICKGYKEVVYVCGAAINTEITDDWCQDNCARCGCSTHSCAVEAERLLNGNV